MSVVLMYHGVYPDNDSSAIDPEDLPYAVRVSEFTQQLDLLAELNTGLISQGELPDVVIGFDDGHGSNLHLAAPLLLERNLSAYFFITTDFLDKRAGFMSSRELAELSRMPGMCIGSHGMTHRFFDDLSSADASRELISSRQTLEALCGSACRSISFPGGRFKPETLSLLKPAGYSQWFGSEIGLLKADRFSETNEKQLDNAISDRWSLSPLCELRPIERVAIRRTTQLDEFRRIIRQDSAYFQRKRLNSQVKHLTRRILGNRLYHGLYKYLSTN